MKKIFFMLTLILSCVVLQAQDNVMLKQIEDANASLPNIVADFEQTKQLVNGKKIVSNGVLYIADNDKMAMYYDEPSTDMLIINAESFYMKQGKKDKVYNTEKNKPMASLRNTLLSCVRGRLATLAQENNAEIVAQKTANGYEVTLTSREKKAKGYARIHLVYNVDKVLVLMQMDEYNGISTTYKMTNVKRNVEIDALRFKIS